MINEENNSSGQQDKENQENRSNVIKRPEDWTTGDEEMTGAQRSYLKTLAAEESVKTLHIFFKSESHLTLVKSIAGNFPSINSLDSLLLLHV